MSGFRSVFAHHLAAYIKLRRALGLRFLQQERVLRAFDRFAHHHHHESLLSEELVRAFATAGRSSSATVPPKRYQVVRHFAEYLSTFEPRTPRLNPQAFRRGGVQSIAYVFTTEELSQLLCAAATVSCRWPILSRTVHALIGLAASTGLRLREVVGLDVADVDLDTGVMIVRRTKFDKDRLVPVHATTLAVLRAYAAVRQPSARHPDELAFFLSSRGRRFTPGNLEYIFRQLVRRMDLRHPRQRPPTFYSLRHSFAVERLIAWYRAGANVQALLPALATYMGHVHYTSTAYYLTATAELLGVAADRLAAATREAPNASEA